MLQVPASGPSLRDLVAPGAYIPTSLGRSAWKGLISGSSLQPNCNLEGINVNPTGSSGSTGPGRVRIGIVANQENDCASPDSYIGFGGGGDYCGMTQIAAGNTARCLPDNGDVDLEGFGVVFVR